MVLFKKHLNRIGLSFTLRFWGLENGIIAAELFVNELTVLLNAVIWLVLVLLVSVGLALLLFELAVDVFNELFMLTDAKPVPPLPFVTDE